MPRKKPKTWAGFYVALDVGEDLDLIMRKKIGRAISDQLSKGSSLIIFKDLDIRVSVFDGGNLVSAHD